MRLITWNIAHRTSRITEQLKYLIGIAPDVIALQEVTPNYLNAIQPLLYEAGFTHIESSLKDTQGLPVNRSYGVLIAAKLPMKVSDQIEMPWSEKSLSVVLIVDASEVGLTTAYIPPGSTNG